MSPATLLPWARAGALRTERREGWFERGGRVTERALAEFRAAYATATEVAGMAGLPSGRWATDRLAFVGVRPVEDTPTRDGPRRWARPQAQTHLFRRADLTPDVLRRLIPEGGSATRAESAAAAAALAGRVGREAGAALGLDLRRTWNGFADASGGVYVQVIVGRRRRFRDHHVFRFNRPMRARLEAALEGWLALAPLGQKFFLLVPWREAAAAVGSTTRAGDRHIVYVPISGAGEPGVFAEFRRPLGQP